MRQLRTSGVAAALALVAGCADNDLGREKRRPNQPPHTIMSSGPRDSTYSANYRAHFYWTGSDPDGTIDHFDFILIDHPAGNDSIAAQDPSYAHRVVVAVPAPDDPRWTATAANDTILLSQADTLRVAPAPPPDAPPDTLLLHNEFVRRQQFQRWHTFFVRAVDNEGAIDATPEYSSFNANTLAPVVFLQPPVDPLRDYFIGPRVIVFNWEGSDPVGEGTTIQPIASRWTIVQTTLDRATQAYNGYPDTLYTLGSSAWSPWRPWDARDRSGRQAIVRNLSPEARYYLFAVQAMDEAGAVTPIFDAQTPGQNNVARILVSGEVGPTIRVQERFLGEWRFVGISRPVRLDVAVGQPLTFSWEGDASSYGGEVVAYRYGWDIRNPSNDQEWQQGWCGPCTRAQPRGFASGTHRFFLEARDNAESITRAEFEIVVHQVTRRRDLLFVDDTEQPQGEAIESLEDRRWRTAIEAVLERARDQGLSITFDPGRDIYDVLERNRLPPPLSLVFDYKTIVWPVVHGRGSALNAIADFVDPHRDVDPVFNYLNVYLENDGELWISGEIPGWVLFTDMDRGNAAEKLPVNITNWTDPEADEEYPDSVGVPSLLWKMGVEMVDLGAGSRAPSGRESALHGCLGFQRATPDGYAAQEFTSTAAASHTHTLVVETADVDAPPDSGRELETSASVAHLHHVRLTADDYRTLARGGTVHVPTDTIDVPFPHAHAFELVDPVGLWGAPARLEPDRSYWPLPAESNPQGARVNVEIYNMPDQLARARPPLQPDPRVSVVLYTYRSASPANPNVSPPYVYEQTADGQPVIVLRRAAIDRPDHARAICGFEVWRLRDDSMVGLAANILLRHFRLGMPETPMPNQRQSRSSGGPGG